MAKRLLLGHPGVDVSIADMVRSSAITPASYPISNVHIDTRMTQQQQQLHHLQVSPRGAGEGEDAGCAARLFGGRSGHPHSSSRRRRRVAARGVGADLWGDAASAGGAEARQRGVLRAAQGGISKIDHGLLQQQTSE
jgi:hypothetical protein